MTFMRLGRLTGVALVGALALTACGSDNTVATQPGPTTSGSATAAVCSHRPVLPALLAALAQRCPDASIAHALLESAGPGLVKGEVLVAHIRGLGPGAEVVAVERHDTR